MTRLALLPDRGVLALCGPDRVGFLQGLVTADVARVAPGEARWSALLTPQGRFLAEFFLYTDGERLLLEGLRASLPELHARLARYRLRAQVELTCAPLLVFAAWDGPPPAAPEAIVGADTRLAAAGWRLLAQVPLATNASPEDWQERRIRLGLPDSADLEPGRTLPLEAGFDALGAVAWDKGCYLGQEVTARSRYRGLVRRHLVRVSVRGPLPALGTPVSLAGTEVGQMRSGCGSWGLALLRLEALAAGPLVCGEAKLLPQPVAGMEPL